MNRPRPNGDFRDLRPEEQPLFTVLGTAIYEKTLILVAGVSIITLVLLAYMAKVVYDWRKDVRRRRYMRYYMQRAFMMPQHMVVARAPENI